MTDNIDTQTVEGFGREWTKFDFSEAVDVDLRPVFDKYFAVFPWARLEPGAEGFDIGCGTGRWARFVAPRVGRLHCLDASAEAVAVAGRNLQAHPNVTFHVGSVGELPFAPDSMDFGYSLGVLHHVPDTQEAIRNCVRALKPGAPLLLYLYYAFDNRPKWFRYLWRATDVARAGLCRLPVRAREAAAEVIAAAVYWPLARAARTMERVGFDVASVPLSAYRDHRFYVMRNDALDRFGTRLEQRFTRDEIEAMMQRAGLEDIRFSDETPFWCAAGIKRGSV